MSIIKKSLVMFTLGISIFSFSQTKDAPKTIHVFVALCDNINQGIVPVPTLIGNGQDPKNNLYWGALYGVKNFFKNKSTTWLYKGIIASNNATVLERVLFKHRTKNIYLLAEAYDGKEIKRCIEDFLYASNANLKKDITYEDNKTLKFGGASDMVVYVGHDGLMEFQVTLDYKEMPSKDIDAIMLACASKNYFANELKQAKATPVLWTTNLMAPEAYTLEAALNSWSNNETEVGIKEAAAQAYHKYQKCSIKGARNLFVTGF